VPVFLVLLRLLVEPSRSSKRGRGGSRTQQQKPTDHRRRRRKGQEMREEEEDDDDVHHSFSIGEMMYVWKLEKMMRVKRKRKKDVFSREKIKKKHNEEQSRFSIDLFRFLEGLVGNNSRMHIAHVFVRCTYSKYYVFKMRDDSPKV
jgi:hypothetical protein